MARCSRQTVFRAASASTSVWFLVRGRILVRMARRACSEDQEIGFV